MKKVQFVGAIALLGASASSQAQGSPEDSATVPPAATATTTNAAIKPEALTAVAPTAASESAELGTVPVETAEQPTAAETPQRKSSSRLIEEIVVTAQKREEQIQNVPISIAAFSAEALDARGAFDTKALATITPAVSITEFGGFSFIFIRGVGSDAFVPSADPSVTTYVDGIFVPTSQGFSTDFGGVERVEVLKGPQGTLFGRNSTGGAINVITKKPGGEFEGSIQTTLANYDDRRIKAYLNVPVTDWFGVSIDGLFKEYDSQYRHENRKLLGHKNEEYRVKGFLQPTDDISLAVTYNHSDQESVGSSISNNIDPSPAFSAIVGGPDDDNYVIETDFAGVTIGYAETLSGTLEWALPAFDFKLIAADQTLNQTYTSYDFDGSSVPLVGFDTYGQFTEATNYEIQFLSRPDGWLGEDFEWVVGGYYLDGEGGFRNIFLRPATDLVSVVFDPILDQLPADSALLDTLQAFIDPASNLAEPNLLARGGVGTKSISEFAQGTWFATEWLKLTLGGRYTNERRFLTFADTSAFEAAPGSNRGPGPVPTGVTIPIFNYDLQSKRNKNFASKAAISVTPCDNTLFYLSRSTGFKSATYNVINIYSPPSFVKPEEVISYELGMKSDFFDRALRFNAAVFHKEVKNKQAAFVSLISGGAVALLNAEQATIKGAEFDMTLVPFANANPGFVLTANGAYLDAKYDKYTDGRGFGEVSGIYMQGLDFSGQRVERTPKFSGGLGISQTFDGMTNGEVEIGADGYYNSGFFFSAENKSNYEQDAYALLNGRVSYLYLPWDVRVTLFGKNLTNERYQVALFETDFGILSTLAYQRQYGLTVNWSF